MERTIAENKSKELKIDVTQIVREFYEVLILKGLFDSPQGKYLIFKGGPQNVTIKKSELKRELQKYLPRNYWPVIERLGP